MLKILLKKQLLEMAASFYMSGKDGKKRSGFIIGLYGLLMVYVVGVMGWLFYSMADMLCLPLVQAELGWLYFALIGILATTAGVVGSVFMTYSMLYQAKDNELLLSMPIPPRVILLSRILGVYLIGMLFEAVVILPAVVVYFKTVGISAAAAAAAIVLVLVLPMAALVLSCILGWLIAIVASRMKQKNFVILFLSVGFIALYYYVIAQANTYLQYILTESGRLGSIVKSFLYPFYLMGKGAEGDILSLVLFCGMICIVFGIVYGVLSATFLKLSTTKRGWARKKYKETDVKMGSVGQALLRKEISRFFGSSTYMMNCGIGSVFQIVCVGAAIIYYDTLQSNIMPMLPLMGLEGAVPLLICGAAVLIASMNTITASSVTLEGKTLWIIKSLPVSGWQVLKAKLKLHMLMTAIPAVVCGIALNIIFQSDMLSMILVPVCIFFAVLLFAAFGLLINLKMPNLNWTNETVAVKQSMSTMVSMFGNWGIAIVYFVLYNIFKNFFKPEIMLGIYTILTAAVSAALLYILKGYGTKVLEKEL